MNHHPIKGSCHCGAVAYQVQRFDGPINHCYCRTCRKTHAAMFNSSAHVKREDFKWTRGEELLSHYESSPGKWRHFCSRCGAHLVAEREGLDYVTLRSATLDDSPPENWPQRRIWTSHRLPWLVDTGLEEHPEWPPRAEGGS